MQIPPASWDERIDYVWNSTDERSDSETVSLIRALASERPKNDAAALYERASAHDFADEESAAEKLYRAALDAGLDAYRRPRAVIQLASTLRNLGRPAEAIELLRSEKADADGLDDARTSFLALALVDLGRADEAAVLALTALSRTLPEYGGAISRYAAALRPKPNA